MYDPTESPRAAETRCLQAFRKKAAQLRAADPSLSMKAAFVRAVESMPAVASEYQFSHHQLLMAGLPPQPLY
jgi:hypothetical protein